MGTVVTYNGIELHNVLTRQWEQDLQRKQAALTAQVISEIRGRIRRITGFFGDVPEPT